jgi:serine/threonine-protein kinase OSR1/STK39
MVEGKGEPWLPQAAAYSLDTVIGFGSFGLVWKSTCLTGFHKEKKVAIKIIDLEHFPSDSIQDIRREISIMSLSKHKNIISEFISFVDLSYLWIVMPIIDAGSINDIMEILKKSNKDFSGIKDEAIIATILKFTVDGLLYLHQNGQVHRDVKAGNILLDTQGNVYLSDFGVSATLKKG